MKTTVKGNINRKKPYKYNKMH